MYRRVHLASLGAIRCFARTLQERPSLGLLVEEVKVDLVDEEEQLLDEEEAYEVFARLDRLRVLVVGCQKVARVVLNEWFMATFCPELEILSFGRAALHSYPLCPYHAFRHIDLHPTLRSVRLTAVGIDFAMATHFAPRLLASSASVSGVKELYLEGWLDQRTLTEVARAFDKLQHLHLTFTSPNWDIMSAFALLREMPCAPTLTHLTLQVPHDETRNLIAEDVPPLAFPSLQHLTWNLTLRSPAMLTLPHLRALTLGAEYPASILDEDILAALLDPETQKKKLDALEVLNFDEVDLSPVVTTDTGALDEALLAALATLRSAGVSLESKQLWASGLLERR